MKVINFASSADTATLNVTHVGSKLITFVRWGGLAGCDPAELCTPNRTG